MKRYINYGKQSIFPDDIKEVTKTLRSDFLTTGPKVKQFENNFSMYTKVKYSISCSNGTAALYLAFKSIRLKKNDVIIIPAINFIAAVNMASILGAKIFLSDVDPLTGQMTPDLLRKCIKENSIKKIKAICTMHNGGNPLNAKEIYKISKEKKCYLIEDACHSLGGKYNLKNNIKVGSCKYSDISTFSFHPVKSITTGEGGMITTNNLNLKNDILKFRNHGIHKNLTSQRNNWSYDVIDHSFNFRLSDIQAALGCSQLKKIDKFIKKRKKISQIYNSEFKNYHLVNIKNNIFFNTLSSWHLYILNINFKKLKIKKDKLIQELYKRKISVQVHYMPTFFYKKFKNLKKKSKFKGALSYFNTCLSLPIYPNLKNSEAKKIIKIIKKILKDNVR